VKKLYTLIELLVTVTVIGILATLLISVMGVAIQKQKAIECINNGKGIISTTFQFAADNNGLVPQRLGNVGWEEHLTDYYGYNLSADVKDLTTLKYSQVPDTYDPEDFVNEFRCPASDLVVEKSGSEVVLQSYSMHKASRTRDQMDNPWRKQHTRGICSPDYTGGNSTFIGYPVRIAQIKEPSRAIAFAEYIHSTIYFGGLASVSLEDYSDIGPSGADITDDFTLEQAWPHGFGKLTTMLCDGRVQHGDLQDTVDDGFVLWQSESRREIDNGLWDCWRGVDSEAGQYIPSWRR